MNFLDMKDKPPLFAGLAAVSLMILAGTAVALTIVTPIFVVLSPILVPAVFTLSFLATGFLASGSLGASAIALLVWLYKKEEDSKYTLHGQEVWPEGANNLAGGDYKPAEENKSPGRDKPAEEDNLPRSDNKSTEEYKPADEDRPLEGVKKTEEETSIPEISKVLFEEQNPIGPKCCGPSTSTKRCHQIGFAMDSTKVRSIFIKEYKKVPRVGAFAYKYLTSRDKNT